MSFTPGQVFTFVIAVVGLVLTVLNIYDKISNIKKAADAPIKELEKRVDILEVKSIEYENSLLKGNDAFRNQAEYNKMFMQIMLAFIDFELAFCNHTNYADIEDLAKAKKLVQDLMTNSMR